MKCILILAYQKFRFITKKDLELMAFLYAAAIHDAEHTGTTNAFHVSIQEISESIIKYSKKQPK